MTPQAKFERDLWAIGFVAVVVCVALGWWIA